jgi:hypothetical protein
MTTVINLLGGPNCGKSTVAAELYAQMKRKHMNVEMVREVAKEWAWEGKKIGPFEQIAIIGEQIKRESSLFGKVDYIVTDSPVVLGAFYFEHNHKQKFMGEMVYDYYKFAKSKDIKFEHYIIPRTDEPYNQIGRFETEEQAKDIDSAIHFYMFQGNDHSKIVNNILKDLK